MGCRRWILHQIAGVLALAQDAAGHGVIVMVELLEHGTKGIGIARHCFVIRQNEGLRRRLSGFEAQPPNRPVVFVVLQRLCQRRNRFFTHAVDQDVRFGVEQDRSPDAVRPEVIVGNTPQAGLNPAQNDGNARTSVAADQIGVDDDGPVRTAVVDAARREIVGTALFLQGRVVGHHGIHTSPGDAPEKGGVTQSQDILRCVRIGLGDDPHPVAGILQNATDDGHADVGAVDVAIARHQDDIQSGPPAVVDVFLRGWQKRDHRRSAGFMVAAAVVIDACVLNGYRVSRSYARETLVRAWLGAPLGHGATAADRTCGIILMLPGRSVQPDRSAILFRSHCNPLGVGRYKS